MAHLLHSANTCLVYAILGRLVRSRLSAAIGAMLFASELVFADIYWDFGTIFELLAAFFSFGTLLFWTRPNRSWAQVLVASLAVLMAMKSKEMAVVIPVILVGYDLLLGARVNRNVAVQWILPVGLAILYRGVKVATMRGVAKNEAYYMSINAVTFATGFAKYLNLLFRTTFAWQIWAVIVAFALVVSVMAWTRRGFFCFFYILVTFLPVIFLVNHRFSFYWYVPFLGVCGLPSLAANQFLSPMMLRYSSCKGEAAMGLAFALLCWAAFLVHKETGRSYRSWVRDRAVEYRAFVMGLRSLPAPPAAETLYFDSVPSFFDQERLLSATQVALRRTDLNARSVVNFPPNARYRLRFKGARLLDLSQAR